MSKIICCDLGKKEGEGYQKFSTWLIGIDGCCQISDSCWVVSSVETAKQIRDRLYGYFGPDQLLFVANLERGSGAWLNVLESSEVLQNILKDF